VGCTIVPWRRPGEPSHNPRVGFLIGQLYKKSYILTNDYSFWFSGKQS